MSNPLTLSSSAVARLKFLETQREMPCFFRIRVDSGGCSGLQYAFSFETEQNPEDVVITQDGVGLVVDDVSLTFLQGVEVDFVEELMGHYFQIKNPNSKTACGCGNSFSI